MSKLDRRRATLTVPPRLAGAASLAFVVACGTDSESSRNEHDVTDALDQDSQLDAADRETGGDAGDDADDTDTTTDAVELDATDVAAQDTDDATDDADDDATDDAQTEDGDGGTTGPEAPIAVLPGDAADDATDAMIDIGPFVADEADRDGVFLRRRLSAVIAEGVTVGELNAVLSAAGAELAGAMEGLPFVSLQVPPMDDYEAALERCDELVASGVFVAAYPATMFVPEPVFNGGEGSKATGGAGIAYWHETMRTYAAWNGASLLVEPTTVVVADTWAQISSHPDISAQRFAPGAQAISGTASDGTAIGNHGFWVAGILGADVDSDGAAGTALRAASALDILSVQVGGVSFFDALIAIERATAATSGRLVINTSIGYNDPGEVFEKRDARALYALLWRSVLQRLGPDRVIVLTAAGNDGAVAGVTAELSSPFATQALVADLSTLIEPAGQAAWTALEARATHLSNTRQVVGNTLVVGASGFAGVRASFSTPGHDVLLPGEAISGPCVDAGGRCDGSEMIDNGTSAAAPLASGLAAMAWSVAPSLDSSELRALLLRFAGDASIDAFGLLLGAAATADIDPLLALADSDDDGDIDQDDISTCMSEWASSESANPDPAFATRDWQRCDLNGDGYSRTDIAASVDLDASETFDTITIEVDGVEVDYSESALTDFEVLCLAMYGPLFSGDENARDEELAAFCSGDELLPSPDAVWVGTVTATRVFSEVGQYFRCIDSETELSVSATFDVECTGTAPGAGGSCSMVRVRGTMDYYTGNDPQRVGSLYEASTPCEPGGVCGSGQCFDDLDCDCAAAQFCTAEGICARGQATAITKNDYRASGGIRLAEDSGEPLLSFGSAAEGSVSLSLRPVFVETDGTGGRLVTGLSFAGDVTTDEREAAAATYASSLAPWVGSTSLFGGSDPFEGTATDDTITAEWSVNVDIPIGTNGSLSDAQHATISLRRIR